MQLNDGAFSFQATLSFIKETFCYHLARGFLIVALLISSTYAAQKEYKYSVRGRVVDAQGQPVQGAVIYLDPFVSADQIFGCTTGPDGEFHLEEITKVPQHTRRLYVTGPIPPGTPRLIAPPFNLLPKLTDPAFSGQLISMEQNGEVDLGDVPVQISYAVVKIFILGKDGTALLKTRKRWEDVNFRIRNVERIVVYDTSLSQKSIEEAVNLSESSIAIALPEGGWYLEVAPFGFEGPWFASSDELIVQRASNQLQLTFKVSVERRGAEQSPQPQRQRQDGGDLQL
jgi:hypothetical protein